MFAGGEWPPMMAGCGKNYHTQKNKGDLDCHLYIRVYLLRIGKFVSFGKYMTGRHFYIDISNKRRNEMKKRLLSVLLALVMVVGVMPTAAFAAEEKETINYVSIGDSMANGYCFEGYAQGRSDEHHEDYDFLTGEYVYGEGAYPLQFEAYLEEQGYQVNHTKLAPSALLPEDLLYLLDGREEADDGWWGYKSYVGNYSDEELKPYIQDAITNADVITMGVGNASFGAYLLDKVTAVLGIFGGSLNEVEDFEQAIEVLELDEEQYALVTEMYNDLVSELIDAVPAKMVEAYNLDQLVDIISYTAASFVVNYKLLLDKIVEMNPDVEIVLVGLLNTTYGINVTDDNGEVLLPIGDVMDGLFGALNAYIAGLPVLMQSAGETAEAWEDVTFYYAEQPEPKFICQKLTDLLENDWVSDDPRLSGKTVRKRNVSAFNSALAGMIGDAVTGAPLASISLDDVEVYEALDWDALAEAFADYGWNPWAAFYFSGHVDDPQEAFDLILSVAIYLAFEEAVANSTDTMDIQLPGLLKIAGDLSSVFTGLGTPSMDSPETLRAWMLNGLSTEEIQGMCKIYALFKVGNGMSVHPTPEGHDEIAASVIAAYEGKHTASDETVKNLLEAYQFLLENYEEIYKVAYQIADKAGYIAEANGILDEVEANIAAIDLSALGLSAKLQAEVEALMAEILEDIAAIRAIVNSPVHPAAEFYALMNELAEDLVALQKVAGQANEDLYAAVMSLQIKLEEVLAEALTSDEQIRAAYEIMVEELTTLAEQYGPEAEAFVREWLYENPKAVLETILAYGKDIDAMLNHWNYHLSLILGPAWNAYGEDLLAALEEVLAVLGEEAAALSAQAAATLMAYIESLDLDIQIETIVDAVINGSVTIGEDTLAELQAIIDDLKQDLGTNVDAVVAALEKATSGSVQVDCVATYTAIGDEADAYTSELAELLGVKVAELTAETDLVTIEFGGEELSAFVNGQIAGMIADTVEMNQDLMNILNSSYGAMILAELEKLGIDLTAETAPLAWDKYLDEKAIGVKNETLAGIAQVLMDHDALMEVYTLDVGAIISPIISEKIGLEITVNCVANIPVAELAVAAIDSLLYAYVDTAAQCAAALEGVRTMAPEAEVVILGLTDAAEELDLKIANMAIDLGEYEDAIGAFANAHYFAYALLNGENTTFVAEKDADAIYAALNVTENGHVWETVVTAPTCTEGGYTTYACSKCGETYTADETAAIDHAWGEWTDNGDGTHSRICANDASHVENKAHDFTDGDCVCGAKKPAEDKPTGGGGGSSRDWHCPTCKSNTCHSKAFSDLDLDAWYHEYTDYVLCKGMMNGMGGDIFAPNGETSRAMLTTILYRMAGSPAVSGEMPFADVAAGQWYTDAILWAEQNDVVLGYGDGSFGPMDTITREQIAALFFRFAELKGMKTGLEADLASFKDAGEISAWASDYMEWAVASGMMEGRGAKTLAPKAGTTRAETAALLERWCEEISD